ncbi:TraR/DksA family transcriptional regulator [Modestobacter marinus]|uniref:TraR/DksA family transcriptional regulator n=1 Tax=Modestobacter marinus TaxID=477641 RepID=UPI001C96EBEB|nr:TraR/DksA C4-type zinc finger protein [Modestobacter marinus]
MTTVLTPAATTSAGPAPGWAPFRALLETHRADCVDQRELALAETVTSVPDAVALSRATTLLRTIEEIDAALARLDTGTYGRCVHCGSAIPQERLEFRPFAASCVSCQQTR